MRRHIFLGLLPMAIVLMISNANAQENTAGVLKRRFSPRTFKRLSSTKKIVKKNQSKTNRVRIDVMKLITDLRRRVMRLEADNRQMSKALKKMSLDLVMAKRKSSVLKRDLRQHTHRLHLGAFSGGQIHGDPSVTKKMLFMAVPNTAGQNNKWNKTARPYFSN